MRNLAPQAKLVVGDRFSAFASAVNALTFSQAQSLSQQAKEVPSLKAGQGLSRDEKLRLIANSFARAELTLSGFSTASLPCDASLVHKKQQRNAMISAPVQLEDCHYQSTLQIDDACDDLADHLTGLHLPGAVLAEAARQMVLAVGELYLVPEANRGTVRFVTNEFKITHATYAFPVATTVDFYLESRRGVGGSFAAHARIEFTQNGRRVASAFTAFSVIDSKYADGEEKRLALMHLEDLGAGL